LEKNRDGPVQCYLIPAHSTEVSIDLQADLGRLPQGLPKGRVGLVVRGEDDGILPLNHEDDGSPVPLLDCLDELLHVPPPPLSRGIGKESYPPTHQSHRLDLDEATLPIAL